MPDPFTGGEAEIWDAVERCDMMATLRSLRTTVFCVKPIDHEGKCGAWFGPRNTLWKEWGYA